MKTLSITILTVFISASALIAQDTQSDSIKEISNDNGFEKVGGYWNPNVGMNKKTPGGTLKKVPGGRSGKCLELKNSPTSVFAFYSKALIPVNLGTDTIKMNVYVKGKGQFKIGFYCYSNDKKYVTTFMQKNLVEINSQEWIKKEFTYDFSKQKAKKVAKVRIAFEVKENSDLLFDDFSGILITRQTQQ